MQGLRSHNTKMHKGDRLEKNYSSKCNDCDDQFETKRKYKLIQHVLKHKDGCPKAKSFKSNNCKLDHKRGSCEVCGFTAKSEQTIKRHLRDKHDVMSVSTPHLQRNLKFWLRTKVLKILKRWKLIKKKIV